MCLLQAMLVQGNISIKDDWSSVQGQLASSSAFSAVESELDRQAMFQDHIAELQVTFLKDPTSGKYGLTTHFVACLMV